MNKNMQPGDSINGTGVVILFHRLPDHPTKVDAGIVLAYLPSNKEWVTWLRIMDGDEKAHHYNSGGAYFEKWEEAIEDYLIRTDNKYFIKA